MKIEVYQCDCCQKEIRPGVLWWQNCNGGEMTITPDGLNARMKFDNLCLSCRQELHAGFMTAFERIQSQLVKKKK